MKAGLIGLLLATSLLVAAPALAAVTALTDDAIVLATEAEGEGDEGEQAPPTTAVSEGGIEPAELAPPSDDVPAEDQWTARFLAPTVAILGAVGIVLAFVIYGVRLRGRYKVVE